MNSCVSAVLIHIVHDTQLFPRQLKHTQTALHNILLLILPCQIVSGMLHSMYILFCSMSAV